MSCLGEDPIFLEHVKEASRDGEAKDHDPLVRKPESFGSKNEYGPLYAKTSEVPNRVAHERSETFAMKFE